VKARRTIKFTAYLLGLAGAALLGAGEVWIVLFGLGALTSFTTALILESAAQAVWGALFLVPGALGVQESGYLLVGGLLGIHGDIALSLVRRVRDPRHTQVPRLATDRRRTFMEDPLLPRGSGRLSIYTRAYKDLPIKTLSR
jgi:hypothetical protein